MSTNPLNTLKHVCENNLGGKLRKNIQNPGVSFYWPSDVQVNFETNLFYSEISIPFFILIQTLWTYLHKVDARKVGNSGSNPREVATWRPDSCYVMLFESRYNALIGWPITFQENQPTNKNRPRIDQSKCSILKFGHKDLKKKEKSLYFRLLIYSVEKVRSLVIFSLRAPNKIFRTKNYYIW